VQDEFKRAGLPKFDFGGRAAAKAKEEPASREVPLEAKIGETIARTLKPPGEGGASGTPERGRDYAVPPGERGAGGVPERGRDYTGPPGERGAGGVPERKRRSLTKDDQVSMSPGGIPRDLEDFITKTEKFRATPYDDFKQRSFGYGTDARGRSSISEPEARQEMRAELARHAQGIDRLNPNLPDGVKKALVSLAYNVGAWYRKPATNDDGSPSLRGLIERGELAAAREKFLQFDKAGGAVNRGLQKRRRDELAEFWPQNTSIARK
jgi:GH24 family phage-related lysozyme (muramidase)